MIGSADDFLIEKWIETKQIFENIGIFGLFFFKKLSLGKIENE